MTTATNYTIDAQEQLGEFVVRAGKSVLVARTTNVFGESVSLKITVNDVAEFYRAQANNLSSGVRVLAGFAGDWRGISSLADLALDWFKAVNVEGMRRAARKVGLEPKF